MIQRVREYPRRITLRTAMRYLNMDKDSFISCAHGYGWILYKYYESEETYHKRKPNGVGNEGRKYMYVAHVMCVSSITGNKWTNPNQYTNESQLEQRTSLQICGDD